MCEKGAGRRKKPLPKVLQRLQRMYKNTVAPPLETAKNRADQLDSNIVNGLYKLRFPLFFAVVTVLAFWARTYFWPIQSLDYLEFLQNWVTDIRNLHGFHSIGTQIGNYTAPYHYLLTAFTYIPHLPNLMVIKIPSTIADFVLAAAVALLVWQLTRAAFKSAFAYCIVLCLPTVFLNSAAWGQNDAMYTAIVMFTLLFWMQGRRGLALFVYGLALSVKLQAIFVMPALVILWACGRLRLRHFLGGAAGYTLAFLPQIIASGSFRCMIDPYTMQTKIHALSPNTYNGIMMFGGLTQEDVYLLTGAFIIFALLGIGAVGFVCWQKKAYFNKDTEFLLLLLMMCFVPYIMPGMHERYFYMIEVAAIVYAVKWPRRFIAPLCLQFATLPSYIFYLRRAENPFGDWLILIMAVPVLLLLWDTYRHLAVRQNSLAPAGAKG